MTTIPSTREQLMLDLPGAPPVPARPRPGPTDEYSLLPGLLGDMARQLGISLALHVARVLGGQRVPVPQVYTADIALATKVGPIAAQWLVAQRGGELINIRRATAYERSLRDRRIVERVAAGKSYNEIAAAERMDFDQVAVIVRRARQEGRLRA